MAAILCRFHGKQYCVFCSAVVADFIERNVGPEQRLLPLRLRLFGEDGVFWVDEEFVKNNQLGAFYNGTDVAIEDEDRAFELYAKLTPVCVRCYEDYLTRQGMSRPELA